MKGTAGKSSSGASMSKYDVEVEERLKALEEVVAALQAQPSGGGGDVSKLIDRLNEFPSITQYCTKDSDGVRRMKL